MAAFPEPKANIFALIVGIDNYWSKDFSPLLGPVNDARAFNRFLLDPRSLRGLQVPASNIVLIENEKATRENILATFKSHFLDNPNIPDHGETSIVLFYAGYGTHLDTSDDMVKAICPVDERTTDDAGTYVHAIPDYLLGWMLWKLAEKKGPNITVIFDSCYLGGIGRDIGKARGATSLSLDVPLELDSHLWWKDGSATAQSHSMWAPDAASHVLLAACCADETARELRYTPTSVHGRFTKDLITQLRRATLETTTYTDLLNLIPKWSGQTPHCGGLGRNRLVFDGNYPAIRRRALSLTPLQPPGAEHSDSVDVFRVGMGSVEGVVPGTEFSAHAADDSFLATLVALSVEVNHSILATKDEEPLTLPDHANAAVSDWKYHPIILHVFTPPEFPHTSHLFPTYMRRSAQPRKYVQAASPETADIVLWSDGDDIVIERLTSMVLECARETRFFRQKWPSFPTVVDAIAHFNYFLCTHNGSAPIPGFSLEMHRLVGESQSRKADRTVGHDGNMVDRHAVDFTSQAYAMYGFTIRNESAERLFPYFFYFDPERYTIDLWCEPGRGLPLESGGGMRTVGMGSERAFEFSLPVGETSSSGFLKLFMATDYLNFGIEQSTSPFEPWFEEPHRMEKRLSEVPTWDALNVILTMTSKGMEEKA
ncbi:caspase domain-containing protein [Mycena rosella]|uniref:Caspase domain-containing protein n=1 Tax=Mycena rosella TaxID=1033263 RepID=A0AAD7DLN5_MYCRO|nr:caspase domain-containing protein [Mycena rosella]